MKCFRTGSQQGMTQSQEYAIRNMDEICVSTRPVQMCQEDYVVKSFKNQKVGFHCVSRNSVEGNLFRSFSNSNKMINWWILFLNFSIKKGQRLKQQVENDQVIPEMSGKSVHVQGRVQVPTQCVDKRQVTNQEQRRRKQQQQHGQRVELIEQDQQSQYDEESQWETEQQQLTNEEQYEQYRKNRYQEDNEWQKMQSLFGQYPELTHKKLHVSS